MQAGKPVFAHVSNDQGIEVALQSGVDILAHTIPSDDLWSSSFAERLTAAHMALTPTLTLWDVEAKKGNASRDEIEKGMGKAAQQVKAFSQAGGGWLQIGPKRTFGLSVFERTRRAISAVHLEIPSTKPPPGSSPALRRKSRCRRSTLCEER
jgi:hypothetical protein